MTDLNFIEISGIRGKYLTEKLLVRRDSIQAVYSGGLCENSPVLIIKTTDMVNYSVGFRTERFRNVVYGRVLRAMKGDFKVFNVNSVNSTVPAE